MSDQTPASDGSCCRSYCSFVFVFLFVVEFVFLVAVFVFLVAVFVLLPLSHCCRAFPQYCTVHAGLIVFKQSLIIKQWSMLKLDAKLPYSCNESTHPAALLPKMIKTHFRESFFLIFSFSSNRNGNNLPSYSISTFLCASKWETVNHFAILYFSTQLQCIFGNFKFGC